MKLMLTILLAIVCQAYTPINERSWVKFRKVKDPTYNTVPQHGEPDIIHTTHILIEERSVLYQKWFNSRYKTSQSDEEVYS